MIDAYSTVRRRGSNPSVDLDSETVILDAATGVYFGVEGVGRSVWEMLEQPRAVADMVTALEERYDVSAARCRSDLLRFLNELLKEGLVEVDNGNTP